MDEMTGPGEDSQKHKSDDAAKYLAESFFGLNLNPADVGGEVLFDDYDDSRTAQLAGNSSIVPSADLDDSDVAFSSPSAGRSSVPSPPNRFEENLDDLIVFSDDDDDDDDVQVGDDEDEDDDENFDFGDEDEDEEDEDDLDEDEDFDEEDDEEEEDDDDELDDVDLDFGDDVMPPAPKKIVPVAQDSRGARSERGSAGRDAQRPAPQHRGERSAERGVRPQESSSARGDSRTTDRSSVAKAADTGRKTAPSDDQYWNELDGWVWDDDAKKQPAAILPAVEDDNDDDDDDRENADASSSSRAVDDEDAPKRKRGRRRGGRGRGRGRRDEKESATSAPTASDSQRGSVDFDDDFSEIMFEEDQEDFVSVSAGSAKAQRRLQDEPAPPALSDSEHDEEDDEDSGETPERADAGDNRASGSRRGRRGRRGRGRGRTETQEPARGDDRAPARGPRTVRDEDEIDDDVVEDDIELVEFSDQDDEEEELPRRGRGPRTEQPPRGQGRGRGNSQREPGTRPVESSERPRRQPPKESRGAAPDEPDNRRNPRQPRVAAEFQDIPTWEEAIGSLAIRTPTEEHARRAENRGRRDGGRPPRRRN